MSETKQKEVLDLLNKCSQEEILNKCSQKEIAKMNKYIIELYPNISHQSVFPNSIVCGNYCLWQIRRETERRRNKRC